MTSGFKLFAVAVRGYIFINGVNRLFSKTWSAYRNDGVGRYVLPAILPFMVIVHNVYAFHKIAEITSRGLPII